MIEGVGTWVLRFPTEGSIEALLLRRATDPYRGEWFTVDGARAAGESPREAALRELAEETTLVPRLLLRNAETPSRIATHRGEVWLHSFLALVPPRAEVVVNEEHSDWRWALVEQALDAVPLPSQRAALERAVRRIRTRSTDGLLEALGAERIEHPGGNLRDHLERTAALLDRFGARPALRDAGLLHAAYGTDGFPRFMLDPDDRSLLRALVGDEVERTVYRYAACDRVHFYGSLERGRSDYRDRFDGTHCALRRVDICDLVELTFANELELCTHDESLRREFESELVPLFLRCEAFASRSAFAFFLETFGKERLG